MRALDVRGIRREGALDLLALAGAAVKLRSQGRVVANRLGFRIVVEGDGELRA